MIIEINEQTNPFPLGIGYKSCWMVVEGSTQKEVSDAFLQDEGREYTYKKGLEEIEKSNIKENKLLVTNTYNNQNYIIGLDISDFFYETEAFLERCKYFKRVYVYMTHRVSETHAFALIENGELVRLFSYDEEQIKNIGEPLPEEIALGYNLPKSFDDVWDDEGNYTDVDEEIVIQLAIRQVGIDEEKYPYNDVIIGNMFNYSTDSDIDSYTDCDDNLDVLEENINVQKSQELKNNKTYTNGKCKLLQLIKNFFKA